MDVKRGGSAEMRRRLGCDMIRIRVNQGGDRFSLLEAEIPSHVSTNEVARAVGEVYLAEKLPEWHEASLRAALAVMPDGIGGGRQVGIEDRGLIEEKDEVARAGTQMMQRHQAREEGERICGGVIADRSEDERFYAVYADLMRRDGAREAVLDVEEGCRQAARELVSAREAGEQEEERQRSRECQALVLKSTFVSEEESKRQFAALSARHQERSVTAFREWRRAMADLHKTHKEQLRQFVLDLGSGDAALSGGRGCGWQHRSSKACDPGPVLAAVAATRGGEAKGMMAYVGTSQLKTKVKVRVQAGTALDYLLCTSATRSGRGTPSDLVAATGGEFDKGIVDAMKRCLFGGGAIGLILPSPPPQRGKRFQLPSGLVGACFASAELIFPDLPLQLESILHKCQGRTKLETGDWFITRHSNLPSCHVIFHVITEDLTAAPALPSPKLLQALAEVIRAASSLGVAALALPLVLGAPQGPAAGQGASQVIKVIRSELRAAMVGGGGNSSISDLHFLVPSAGDVQGACGLLKSLMGAAPDTGSDIV